MLIFLKFAPLICSIDIKYEYGIRSNHENKSKV